MDDLTKEEILALLIATKEQQLAAERVAQHGNDRYLKTPFYSAVLKLRAKVT